MAREPIGSPVLDAVEHATAEALASRDLWHVRVRDDAGGDDDRASLDKNTGRRTSSPRAAGTTQARHFGTCLNWKLEPIRVTTEICEEILPRWKERRDSRRPPSRPRS